MIPLFTVYRSAKRRRSRRSAANSSNVSNQPLRRACACTPGYPHHTLSNVTACRIRPAPLRVRVRHGKRVACGRRGRPEISRGPSLSAPCRPCRALSPPLPASNTSLNPRMPLAQRMACMHRMRRHTRTRCRAARQRAARHAQTTICCLAAGVALPLTLIRVQPHSDTMHPLTSALAKSRPQFDSRPQACAHPSVLPPPVAPPLVGAAPPPPAARAG